MSDLQVSELSDFERGLMLSVQQAKRGEGVVHTRAQILARRDVVDLRLDDDILSALRSTGDGWQSRVNDELRSSLRLSGLLP
ncbi:hypothetical protein FACS1894116_14420 [Betaproteobacteria bacterium]|nr:hypothetical protein FACS1894116_14420 [Betaproteobacteria bacterium]GHU26662.1 hypothetical protein FACS189488_14800 [Betaproteobacteria bacterium]GHU33262.1 hypothetical protein FACS189497_14980 [Betaproteobacteria bacterium]